MLVWQESIGRVIKTLPYCMFCYLQNYTTTKKSCQNQAWMLKLQLQESWRLAMLVFVPCCADCRTSCPSLVKFSMASAGTGGLSLLAVQTSFLRTPFNKNSNSIAIALLEESKGI